MLPGMAVPMLLGGGRNSLTVWNSADKSATVTTSNYDLTANNSAGVASIRGNISKSAGKVAFEAKILSVGLTVQIGAATSGYPLGNTLGASDALSVGYRDNGTIRYNTGASNAASAYAPVATITAAFDVPNHLAWFALNGTWQNAGDPATGVNGIDYVSASAIFPAVWFNGSGSVTGIFKNLTYLPSGFSAWG